MQEVHKTYKAQKQVKGRETFTLAQVMVTQEHIGHFI